MAGLAHRAVLVSFARLCNQAIALFSPLILVHLLPVAEFGAYRRFYLYFNLASGLALTAANSSLLYFIPKQREATWKLVRTCARIVAVTSVMSAILIYTADALSGGRLVGERVDIVLLYMVLYVNLDFWEPLALAHKRPRAVLAYTLSRLIARMTTVIVTAALTQDVDAIFRALLIVESVRIMLSAIAWRRLEDMTPELATGTPPPLRAVLEQSLPLAFSVFMATANGQAAGIIVERLQGEVGLAYFTIGTYTYFIVSSVRNAISDVLLPELSGGRGLANDSTLKLWQRSTVVFAILLLPAAIGLACFAEPIIATVFSTKYLPAVPVFQVCLLVLVRECFDFDLALRAAGQPRRAVPAHVLTLVVNVALSLWLVREMGVVGAAVSVVIARTLAGLYLATRVASVARVSLRTIFPWRDLLRVGVAALLAGVALVPAMLYPQYGWPGILSCGAVFIATFVLLLRWFDVREAHWLYAAIERRVRPQNP